MRTNLSVGGPPFALHQCDVLKSRSSLTGVPASERDRGQGNAFVDIKAGIDVVQGVVLVGHHAISRAHLQIDFVRGVVDKLVAGGEAGKGGPAVLVLDAGQGSILAVGGDAGGVGFGFGQGREGQVLRGRGGKWEKARGNGREDGGLERIRQSPVSLKETYRRRHAVHLVLHACEEYGPGHGGREVVGLGARCC